MYTIIAVFCSIVIGLFSGILIRIIRITKSKEKKTQDSTNVSFIVFVTCISFFIIMLILFILFTKVDYAKIESIIGLDMSGLFNTLLFFVIINYILKIIVFAVDKHVNKQIWSQIIRAILIFGVLLFVVACIDIYFTLKGSITYVCICYFIVNKSMETLESLGRVGLPLPEVLKKTLTKYVYGSDNKK